MEFSRKNGRSNRVQHAEQVDLADGALSSAAVLRPADSPFMPLH